MRLREFLAESATVDFTAKTALSKEKKKQTFVNPEYELKPLQWKMMYRAGKPAVDAARAAAQDWLKALGGPSAPRLDRSTQRRSGQAERYAPCWDLPWRNDMATQIADPKTPESKPHGTTTDQVKEMESEGQAQTQGQPVARSGRGDASRRRPGHRHRRHRGGHRAVGRHRLRRHRRAHRRADARQSHDGFSDATREAARAPRRRWFP